MENKQIKLPAVGLIISGGHTCLVYVEDIDSFRLLGQTTDDACGEAFDKIAKMLNLGYPGGPIIEKKAGKGNSGKIKFPSAYLKENCLDFSFSGIKTAVLYYLRDNFRSEPNEQDINDICASFQESVIKVLVDKAMAACQLKKTKRLIIGGGVSANSRLREVFLERCSGANIQVSFPSPKLSLDNGVMVAGLGQRLYKKGKASNFNLTAEPNLGIN
jgi:N6-L-threonylcarbamoyladenine synthase